VVCLDARLVPYDDPHRDWPHVLAARCFDCENLASGFRKTDAGTIAVCPNHGGPTPQREYHAFDFLRPSIRCEISSSPRCEISSSPQTYARNTNSPISIIYTRLFKQRLKSPAKSDRNCVGPIIMRSKSSGIPAVSPTSEIFCSGNL
jgi:hypothetical protein